MFEILARIIQEDTVTNWDKIRQSNPMIDAGANLCEEIEGLDNSYIALIVGGAVRDLLMGKEDVHDVDIATNAPIDVLESTFSTHDIGKSKDFGIVTIKHKGHNFEVANFRKDVYEPGSSTGKGADTTAKADSFKDDAARRDFTFNAMGLTSEGEVVDYYGGADDIRKGVIRAVGDAKQRFEEDAARLLRAIRFASKFGFEIEHDTEQAIKKLAFTINNLAPERIHQELMKTAELGGPALAMYIRKLDRVGLLDKILPEIKELEKFKHNPKHHPEGDVLPHVLAAVEASPSKDPIENLAVLFHDLGKATTLGHKDDGSPTYHGHEAAGAPIFDKIADRLKFPNDAREAIKLAITDHMHGHNIEKLSTKKLVQLRQHKHWPVLKNTIYSDEKSRLHLFDPKAFEAKMQYVEDLFKTFGETAQFEAKMGALINGQMIMALVPGIKGKDIGRIKDAVRDWIIENEFNVTIDQVKGKIEQVA